MERVHREHGIEDDQLEVAGTEEVSPASTRFRGGLAPAVDRQISNDRVLSASDRAYGATEAKAAADTQRVLEHIRTQAKARAIADQEQSISPDSMLYQRLSQHYLKDYLENPSPAAGKAAIEKVGEQQDPSKADPNDFWEASSAHWNAHDVPASVKLLLPDAPDQMGAATAILNQENRAAMPYIDAPQMIGNPNTDTGQDSDVFGGGKNISQLMHWGTGVKHAENDPTVMRDLFLAYEMYHLEGWDAFGEDAINDMISEEAGRIMGRQLLDAEIDQGNLGEKLDSGFNEARAWVGSLIKARQGELDAMITSKTVVESEMWYGQIPGNVQWWGDTTIYLELLDGKSVEEICADSRTAHFIEIYSLIYYSDLWQKQNSKIKHSAFTQSMLAGKYDTAFEKSVKGEEMSKDEKLDAFLDAKAPWVPKFMRRGIQKIPAVDRRLGGDNQ
jgi:hypothetical protein